MRWTRLFPPPDLQLDAPSIDRRLGARLGRGELLGVAIALAFTGIFLWLNRVDGRYPVDFAVFLEGKANPNFFYADWIRPLFALLDLLPRPASYALWALLNIAGLFLATRVFGGRGALALASYQFLTVLYYGQITGLLAGGLALLAWGLAHRRWHLAGAGLLLAMTKFQFGVWIALPLLWYLWPGWRNFLRVLAVPALVAAVSLVVYPLWIVETVRRLLSFPFQHLGITLWTHIGAWCLLLWPPVLLLPMPKSRRLFGIYAAVFLATPYILQSELSAVFAFPLGWLPLIGHIGWLFPLGQMQAIYWIALMPAAIYLWAVLPPLVASLRRADREPHAAAVK